MKTKITEICKDCKERYPGCRSDCWVGKTVTDMAFVKAKETQENNHTYFDVIAYENDRTERIQKRRRKR